MDGTPFAAKMFFAMTAMGMAHSFARQQAKQRQHAEMMNDAFQRAQSDALQGTRDGLRGSRAPVFVAPELVAGGRQDPNSFMGVPLGYDQGMVRMASAVEKVARAQAHQEKQALSVPGLGSAAKGLGSALTGAVKAPLGKAARLGALGVGALGVGAYAASKPALGYLSKENPTPTRGGVSAGAPQLAYGVNEYGVPQLGSPFIQ